MFRAKFFTTQQLQDVTKIFCIYQILIDLSKNGFMATTNKKITQNLEEIVIGCRNAT